MFKKTLTAVAAVAVTVGASLAQAADVKPGGYIQGSLGLARVGKPSVVKFVQQHSRTSSSDRSDIAYKLALGLQLSDHFAVEAQYLNLGKAKYRADRDAISLKTSGFGFNAVGSYPLGNAFAVQGRVGLHYLKTKGHYSGWGSDSITDLSPMLGLGATYKLLGNAALVGEYERYFGVANGGYVSSASFKHDADMFSVGILYSF